MSVEKKHLLIIGILIIFSFVLGILSIAPAIDNDNYLEIAKQSFFQTRISIFFQLMLVVIYLIIAVLFFKMIKDKSPYLANSYLVFKIISQVFNAIGIIFIVALTSLSLQYVQTNVIQNEIVPKIGFILKDLRDFSNHVLMIIFNAVSSVFLFIVLRKEKIIPKWISIFGIIGSGLTVAASFLICFNILTVLSASYLILNIPYALCEVLMAILFIKNGLAKKHLTTAST